MIEDKTKSSVKIQLFKTPPPYGKSFGFLVLLDWNWNGDEVSVALAEELLPT